MYAGNFMTAKNGTAFIRALRLSPAFVDRYDDAGLRGLFANLLDQIDTTLGRLFCWHSLIAGPHQVMAVHPKSRSKDGNETPSRATSQAFERNPVAAGLC
jgi:hypothetical protein